jgi:nucleoside-diphosphate-sugar epimerase
VKLRRMRLLVVGGSGHVGRLVLSHLAGQTEVRVLDLVPPPEGPWEYVAGNASDGPLVASACAGVDVLVYMAMNTRRDWDSPATARDAFDVNVTALYACLRAAGEAGVRHAVYTSSMSVYEERDRYPDESVPPDATHIYGLTKRLGEEVCRAWVRSSGSTVTVLRLCFPIADDAPAPTEPRFEATTHTRASDVAAAMLAALDYRRGFEAFTISGDAAGEMTPLGKAGRLLGWRPLAPAPPPGRPTVVEDPRHPAVPRRLAVEVSRPADFEDYWARLDAEVSRLALQACFERDELRSSAEVEAYECHYTSLDGLRIAAWYCRPSPARLAPPYPGLVICPGYISEPEVPKAWARLGYAVISLAPRGKLVPTTPSTRAIRACSCTTSSTATPTPTAASSSTRCVGSTRCSRGPRSIRAGSGCTAAARAERSRSSSRRCARPPSPARRPERRTCAASPPPRASPVRTPTRRSTSTCEPMAASARSSSAPCRTTTW